MSQSVVFDFEEIVCVFLFYYYYLLLRKVNNMYAYVHKQMYTRQRKTVEGKIVRCFKLTGRV